MVSQTWRLERQHLTSITQACLDLSQRRTAFCSYYFFLRRISTNFFVAVEGRQAAGLLREFFFVGAPSIIVNSSALVLQALFDINTL